MARSSDQNLSFDNSYPHSTIQLTIDRHLLRELVEDVLRETIGVLDWPSGRIALDEGEAAEACGVRRHVLRDMRLTGQIKAQKLGRKFVYTREDLLAAIRSNRSNSDSEIIESKIEKVLARKKVDRLAGGAVQ